MCNCYTLNIKQDIMPSCDVAHAYCHLLSARNMPLIICQMNALEPADAFERASASAEGLQQLLNSIQSTCAMYGLAISIINAVVVVFGWGCLCKL